MRSDRYIFEPHADPEHSVGPRRYIEEYVAVGISEFFSDDATIRDLRSVTFWFGRPASGSASFLTRGQDTTCTMICPLG